MNPDYSRSSILRAGFSVLDYQFPVQFLEHPSSILDSRPYARLPPSRSRSRSTFRSTTTPGPHQDQTRDAGAIITTEYSSRIRVNGSMGQWVNGSMGQWKKLRAASWEVRGGDGTGRPRNQRCAHSTASPPLPCLTTRHSALSTQHRAPNTEYGTLLLRLA